MPRPTQPRLTGKCDGCGKPAVYYPERNEHLCSECGEYLERSDQAESHLMSLIEPIVTTWHTHWLERGLGEKEAREVLEFVAANRLLPEEEDDA